MNNNLFRTYLMFISLTIIPNFLFSQFNLRGIVLDSINNKPIEFVDIYNDYNYVISNENGRFDFESDENKVTFRILGYIQKTFKLTDLKSNDTIFLKPKTFELAEVILNSDKSAVLDMFKSIRKNYQLEPYNEEFFLRSVLKKNNKIQEMQDVQGVIERKTLFYVNNSVGIDENYLFNIQQMRKAGVKDRKIDIETYGLRDLFNKLVAVYLSPEIYNFKDEISNDSLTTKIVFEPKNLNRTETTGYYLKNNRDSSFGEVYILNPNPNPIPDKKSGIEYQTTNYELRAWFSKDSLLNKYHLKKARLSLSLKVTDIKGGKTDYYNSVFFLNSKPIKIDESLKNNVSQKKDLFELKGKYNDIFWNKQNTLELSNEMKEFIKEILENGGKNEYKIITNLD